MKKQIVGTGMMAREADFLGPDDYPSFEAYWEALSPKPISGHHRNTDAAKMLAILKAETDWLSDDFSQEDLAFFWGSFPEDSAPSIAALWLSSFIRMNSITEEILDEQFSAENLERMAREAEALGKWKERLFWRAGLDFQTGKRREELALSGRKQTKAGKEGRDMRTNKSFAAIHGVEAQRKANEIAANKPHLSWAAIRQIVAKEFQVSAETVKKSLTNPKKGG